MAGGSFADHFERLDAARWQAADGWANGAPFASGWRQDHVRADGRLTLTLDDTPAAGRRYASGECRSAGYYGYGLYEASFRPAACPGVVSALFTFAGPSDDGGNGAHNEIDVEFRGCDTRHVQLNFWTNDDDGERSHEHLVPLGFDASRAFHRYGFRWSRAGIEWLVDGAPVHRVANARRDPTPRAEESLQRILLNLWAVDETAAAWAGAFRYPGGPVHGEYEWVRYTAEQR